MEIDAQAEGNQLSTVEDGPTTPPPFAAECYDISSADTALVAMI